MGQQPKPYRCWPAFEGQTSVDKSAADKTRVGQPGSRGAAHGNCARRPAPFVSPQAKFRPTDPCNAALKTLYIEALTVGTMPQAFRSRGRRGGSLDDVFALKSGF